MNGCILLGVDAHFSPLTQYALKTAGDLLEQSSPEVSLILLSVIPAPVDPFSSSGRVFRSLRPFPPTSQQRIQAECVLRQARFALQQRGVASERVSWLLRWGAPADEIVRVATQQGVERIVLGSHTDTLTRRVRRVIMGSTSLRVKRLARCSVTLVTPSPPKLYARELAS